MRDLAVRLAALDEDAGAALRVIAYFDGLIEAGAGLQSIVRGAAVLADCPARLDDEARRVHIRVLPDGVSSPAPQAFDAAWPHLAAGSVTVRLERTGPPGPVDAMVLERAVSAARTVLDRTRGRAPAADSTALVELLIDASGPADARLLAARHLGLPAETTAYVLVRPEGVFINGDEPTSGRAGIGPTVPVLDLPASHVAARTALRFTAAGTEEDPGPQVVSYAELGALAALATVPDPGAVPDVQALDHAAAAAPWLLQTLHAVTTTTSLRAAATTLRVHHSTLQDRVVQAEHLLSWSVREPHGRLRVQLALALRRLHRNP
ncbi:helix-turn-helix domain-containing protein [Winogradskya humida]|uniref:PucR C-terminal helix-turn-helix domain-containing protein n=1 Tax=Winogradskya humida TaxID=113566 RepID=A0ABQ4A7V6_9ACTN|nr:helix-turn-helix domain-containing protein [Actinoplanes humidus]GIE26901.1 hypothetical protein Ahu01nite_100030 [Actinoplanes humidus]